MNTYLKKVYIKLENKYPNQYEYLNAVKQFLLTITDYIETIDDIESLNIIERIVEPDRIISFKVPWVDDNGNVKVNIGWRVQHSNLLGVYKGGIRFSKNVNESILKFLAFEQTFKNSLSDLPLGGAKGGSDFDPIGKSDLEIMRFSQNFMRELYKHIGPDIDVPAGDLGVSAKEIGYLYGMYKKLTTTHNHAFTSKGLSFGGSLLRPESTGYGICYVTEKALNTYFNDTIKDKKVIISGAGQVGINTALKAKDLGAKVIAISCSKGVLYDEVDLDLELIKELNSGPEELDVYLDKYPNTKYFKNPKELWNIKADIAIPCATQNELDANDAKKLIDNGLKMLVEGANKPSTDKAIELFIKNKVLFIPSKAANTGGVSVSSLEMLQNATTSKWSAEEVDRELKTIMENIFDNIYETAKDLNNIYNLEKAANVASFKKIYEAMKAQGV